MKDLQKPVLTNRALMLLYNSRFVAAATFDFSNSVILTFSSFLKYPILFSGKLLDFFNSISIKNGSH